MNILPTDNALASLYIHLVDLIAKKNEMCVKKNVIVNIVDNVIILSRNEKWKKFPFFLVTPYTVVGFVCTFTLESNAFFLQQVSCLHSQRSKCQFSTNSHETDYSVGWRDFYLKPTDISWFYLVYQKCHVVARALLVILYNWYGLAISLPCPKWGGRGVFYLFIWFLPAFAAPRGRGGAS